MVELLCVASKSAKGIDCRFVMLIELPWVLFIVVLLGLSQLRVIHSHWVSTQNLNLPLRELRKLFVVHSFLTEWRVSHFPKAIQTVRAALFWRASLEGSRGKSAPAWSTIGSGVGMRNGSSRHIEWATAFIKRV